MPSAPPPGHAVVAAAGRRLATAEPTRSRAPRTTEVADPSAARPPAAVPAPFYTKNGKDVCYIKPDKDYIAFGFAEVANPSQEEGAHMHPVAWTVTSLDESTEDRMRELVRKAAK